MKLSDIAAVSGAPSRQLAAQPLPRSAVAAHGLDNRGLEASSPPGAGFGRFGRMFPDTGRDLHDDCLQAIATAMIKADSGVPIDVPEPVDENPGIPAGYTYFGQFVDHDLTLDTTPLGAKVDVAALVDFRTPALDLDCIYGRGPDDQPYLYQPDGLTLRLGTRLDAPAAGKTRGSRDVLRLADPNGDPPPQDRGPSPAILGDKRNDENRIVVQIQSAFIAFHNKVVADPELIEAFQGDNAQKPSKFNTAVDIVRWHYQWVVLHDYLDRILEPTALSDVLGPGGIPQLPHYDAPGTPAWGYIPVEFAAAAYRFGHSMVRPGYALNGTIGADETKGTTGDQDTSPQPSHRIPLFSDAPPSENLNGFGFALPQHWGIDWSFFLDGLDTSGLPAGFLLPQHSYRIDAQLVDPLAQLPEFFVPGGKFRNLAYRNLVRGTANLRLPSGEQVARRLGEPVLPPGVLWTAGSKRAYNQAADGTWTRKSDADLQALAGDAFADLKATNDRRQAVAAAFVDGDNRSLRGSTPLWYYILRESEFWADERVQNDPLPVFGGQHLGPVGSRIVAETFVGVLWRDSSSYLRRAPAFRPHPKITGGAARFTLAELLKYALS